MWRQVLAEACSLIVSMEVQTHTALMHWHDDLMPMADNARIAEKVLKGYDGPKRL